MVISFCAPSHISSSRLMHLLKTAIDPSFWVSSNRRRSTDGCEAWSSGGGLVLFMTRSVPVLRAAVSI
ncbi:unnamed protein product [Thlaspi arvense]|uniref:Uncharacterized protein n=1 Tax=Thlaspi arvense TaxID=13288 RepID=A0AAU9RX69_THLAR|nr:unnamed protein product [Thlaspi arvense]